MAYKKEDLIEKALEVIEKHKLVFIDDIATFMGIARQTFYDHELDKTDIIKQAILDTKITMKAGLREKWYMGNNPTTQLCLYKLIATQEEHKLLTQNNVDHTTNGKEINLIMPKPKE